MKTILAFLALATALCGQITNTPGVPTPAPNRIDPSWFISDAPAFRAVATATTASTLMIHTDKGEIRVDMKTGTVTFTKDMALPVAAVEFWKAVEKSFPEHFPRKSPHTSHDWAKWSAPEISSDWFNGTRSFQYRVCNTCGEAEAKVVKIYHSVK